MGLRGRLALFFVVITIAPMTVAMAGVQALSTAQLRARVGDELVRTGESAAALVAATSQRAGDLAADLAIRDGVGAALAGPAAAGAWLEGQPALERADVALLASPDGDLLAARPPQTPGGPPPEAVARDAARVAADPDAPVGELLLAVGVVPGAGLVAVGVWLDEALLDRVAHDPAPGSGAAFVADGRVLAATGPAPAVAQLPQAGQVEDLEVDGETVLVGVQGLVSAPGAQLVVWTPLPRPPGLGFRIAVLAVAVAAAAAIGWLLARSVIAPVQRAADVARAVAGGDLSQRLHPSGGRELTDLGEALNAMTAVLARRLEEVERSHDELRRSLSRLGEALSGSLDQDRMLGVVVETAATTLRADGAAVLLLTGDGQALEVKAVRGVGPTGRVGLHEGVAGSVVRTGRPVLQQGSTATPARGATEPDTPYLLALPLQGRGRTNGVLVLVRNEAAGPFGEVDLDTAGGIAAGVAVAIDNIRLHQETERLSLTNAVTGLWNIRYFEPQADKELERARRANERDGATRQVSVLAIDLDHFGRINKEYDQAAGDAALAEVGRRLEEATRDPDVVTHPHGEEFAVLLPDTDYDGALLVAERMRRGVGDTPLALPGVGPAGRVVELHLTCSVGVATYPQHAHDRATLYRAADRAMQQAKERGRDQVVGAEELGRSD